MVQYGMVHLQEKPDLRFRSEHNARARNPPGAHPPIFAQRVAGAIEAGAAPSLSTAIVVPRTPAMLRGSSGCRRSGCLPGRSVPTAHDSGHPARVFHGRGPCAH
eukprot:2306208-Prymnesium_polylepis.1